MNKITHCTIPTIILLMLLITLSTCGSLIVTANLPNIAQIFQLIDTQTNDLIIVYMLGVTLSQLFTAQLFRSQHWLTTLRYSAALIAFGCLISVFSINHGLFWGLCLGRLINGLGTGATYLLPYLLITTAFEMKAMRQTLALSNLAFAFMPYLAIVAGGWLGEHFGPAETLIGFALYALLVIILSHFTSLKKINLQQKSSFFSVAKVLLVDQRILLASLMTGGLSASLYVYLTLCPHAAMSLLQISGTEYGLWQLFSGLAAILGNLCAAQLTHRSSFFVIKLGSILCAACVICLWIAQSLTLYSPITLFAIPATLAFASPLLWGNLIPLFTAHTEHKVTACMLINFVGTTITLACLGLTTLHLDSPWLILLIVLSVIWSIELICCQITQQRKLAYDNA